jgi:ABC-type Fe3+-siderophore transport system permease subunit
VAAATGAAVAVAGVIGFVGIVTAAIGGPFFLWILLHRRGVMDL